MRVRLSSGTGVFILGCSGYWGHLTDLGTELYTGRKDFREVEYLAMREAIQHLFFVGELGNLYFIDICSVAFVLQLPEPLPNASRASMSHVDLI